MSRALVIILIWSSLPVFSQPLVSVDSIAGTKRSAWQRIYRMPTILMGLSLVSMTDNEVFDKWEVREGRNKIAPSFRTHADNYLQFAPIAGVYALNLFGVSGKNRFVDRSVILIKSELLTNAIVFSLKKVTHVMRPDGTTRDAFPSGHTAQAFMAATFLHQEFGEDYPIVSVIGYMTASGVGVLRILNNRHWLSDVLAGAAFGMLSTNVAYATHQHRWGRKHTRLQISPSYMYGSSGVYLKMAL